jgi:hypothetical protein
MEGADPREDELTGSGEQQMPVTPVPLLCWHWHNLPLLLSRTATLALRCVGSPVEWGRGPTHLWLSGCHAGPWGKAGGLPGDEWARAFGISSFFFPAPPLTRSAIAGNVSSRRLRTTQPLIDLDRCLLG